MKKLRFKKINAFTSDESTGNPAAVVYLDAMDDLSDGEMLKIAKELKGFVSEVGYVCSADDTDLELRFFSSEREVAFCGHATIAILNDVIGCNDSLRDKEYLSIATRSERLLVENRYATNRTVYISAPPPRFSGSRVPPHDVAVSLGVEMSDIDESVPVEVVNAGLETLVVPVTGLSKILSVSPDLNELDVFCKSIGVDIIIVYSREVSKQGSDFRTRVFAPTFGYLEDPATGSGNSALAYYLLKHGQWDGALMKIEQNGDIDHPNFVYLFSRQSAAETNRVWFGGGASLKIDGHYFLG